MKSVFALVFISLFLCACHDDSPSASSAYRRHQQVKSYKVAVIMPGSNQERWNRVAQWALENLEAAQETMETRVSLELEWFNEDDTTGLYNFVSRVDADPAYKAVIGPMRTENAYIAATICSRHQKTLILPQCTSAGLQRIFAESPNVFHLTQCDIGQIEVLLSCALQRKAQSVSLLVNCEEDIDNDNDHHYGSTFVDWLGFLAYEAGLKVDTVCTYTNSVTLEEAILDLADLYSTEAHDTVKSALLFVPENPRELVLYDRIATEVTATGRWQRNYPFVLCSDAAVGDETMTADMMNEYEGTDIAAAASSGFIPVYHSLFGNSNDPIGGEAQLFDAIYMLTFALIVNPDDVSAAIVKLTDNNSTAHLSWLPADATFFVESLRKGFVISPAGALGEWTFDSRYHTSLMNTTYRHWKLSNNKFTTIQYISLQETLRTSNNEQLWLMNARIDEQFDAYSEYIDYVDKEDNYAVIVAASTGWRNYRHQADALDIYQMLKLFGYDDDHIILVLEDDLVNDTNNAYPGEIRVSPNGENLYHDLDIDYHPSALRLDDLNNILMGKVTERTPKVLNADSNDNVFIFWTGHGQDGALFFDRFYIYDKQMKQLFINLWQAGKYRKAFFVAEACYGGSIAQDLEGIPGLLCLTAANASEASEADMMDPKMNIWLSNCFTRAFCQAIQENPNITMRNLYYKVAQQTVGSHATMYNYRHYGNMFTNTFREYLPN